MSKKVLVFNLTPRWWMLHYSSQFCNELFLRKDIKLKVAIASYYQEDLYNSEINFIKIRTQPNLKNFIVDSINIPYHLYFWFQIILFKPNIVHFIDNHPWYCIQIFLCKLLWMEIYVTQHDPILHTWEANSLVWKMAGFTNTILRKYSNKLMVHGEWLKEIVVNKYWTNQEKIISIPHWAYTFFNNYSKWLSVKYNTFLFFWRIIDYKWLDVLLESLQYIKKEIKIFTLIIAWPWDISPYISDIEKYKDYIELYNKDIPAHEIYNYFEVSEFVVLPYNDATWSWVIPVAYCFSKPVIVTNVWELISVVEDNQTWFIIPPKSPKILAEIIISMLNHKELTREMWNKWYDFSVKELSWEPIIQKIYG